MFCLVLFGTDLETRLEFERGVIPGIVTRCIEEVELRGKHIFHPLFSLPR